MNENDLRLDLYDNQWYKPGAGKIKLLLWYVINVLFFINPLNPISSVKVALLKAFGAKVGKGVVIKPGVNIKFPWRLTLGNWVWVGERVWIDNLADVVVGDHVSISQGAMLLTGNHNYKTKTFELQIGEIVLENGCWVGAMSVVCPGVTCGTHSVLAVGSIATSSLEPWTIYQGNPAKAIRKRPTFIA